MTPAFAIWRTCDGKPGMDALRTLSGQGMEALALISSARAELEAEGDKE